MIQKAPQVIFPSLNMNDEPMPALQKVRVACYIRVSTDNPEQEDSYEAQDRYFSKLLLSRPDWDSAGVYADYGISGTKKDNRTGPVIVSRAESTELFANLSAVYPEIPPIPWRLYEI